MKRFVRRAVTVVAMLAVAAGAWAIDAKTALDKLGFPSDTVSQVLAGVRRDRVADGVRA